MMKMLAAGRNLAQMVLDEEMKEFDVPDACYKELDEIFDEDIGHEDDYEFLSGIDELLEERGFDFESRYLLSESLLDKRYNCRTGSLIYLSSVEHDDFKVSPVYVPEHIFLKTKNMNWEVTTGQELPDSFYSVNLNIDDFSVEEGYYFRELGVEEFLAENYNTIGNALMVKGDREKAEEYYRRSLEKFSENVGCMNNLARLLLKKGDMKGAERLASDMARIDPNSYAAREIYGKVLKERGELRRAAMQLSKAKKLRSKRNA